MAVRSYGDYLNIGPNSVRLSARALEFARTSPLPEADALAALSAIFQYAYGFTSTEINWAEKAAPAGSTTEELIEEITAAVRQVPEIAESGALVDRPERPDHLLRDRDFHRALDWLLAGMQISAR